MYIANIVLPDPVDLCVESVLDFIRTAHVEGDTLLTSDLRDPKDLLQGQTLRKLVQAKGRGGAPKVHAATGLPS